MSMTSIKSVSLSVYIAAIMQLMIWKQRVDAFIISPTLTNNYIQHQTSTSFLVSKSNDDMEALLRVAHDPKLFEEYIMKKRNKSREDENKALGVNGNNDNSSSATGSDHLNQTEIGTEKKVKYVPIEEWDKSYEAENAWEEKVKFDGQRFGNQFQQNEILRKNLKSF